MLYFKQLVASAGTSATLGLTLSDCHGTDDLPADGMLGSEIVMLGPEIV